MYTVYTHHIYFTGHTMLKTKRTVGPNITASIKLFLYCFVQNPYPKSFVQQKLQHENG